MRSSSAVDQGILEATPPGPAFSFAGQNWHALPQGALFWRERAALIVADLHFEKASAFARHGQMLPPYDSRATLDALEDAIARTSPREIWCLGDSFHDMGAHDRMMAETRERIARLTAACRWTWITGNHDPQGGSGGDSPLGGESHDEALIDGVLLRHEAVRGEARPEISGHFHPKWRMSVRGRHISRRCFVKGARKLIVPAFGTLAGGLDAASPAITSLVGRESEALIALEDRLLRFALRT